MLTPNSIVQRHPDIISAEADQDVVMVSVSSGYYYGVSDVARDIWNAIGEPKRIADLIVDLTTHYEIDPLSCQKQTLDFLEDLVKEGLVQVKYGPVR